MESLTSCKSQIQNAFDHLMKVVSQQEELLRQTLDHAKEQSEKAEEERKRWELKSQEAEAKTKEADDRLRTMDDILREMKLMRAKETAATTPTPEVNTMPPWAAGQAEELQKPPSAGGFGGETGAGAAFVPKGPGKKVLDCCQALQAPPEALQGKPQKKAPPASMMGPPVTGPPPGLSQATKEEARSGGHLKAPPPAPPAEEWFHTSAPVRDSEPPEVNERRSQLGQPAFKVPPPDAGPNGIPGGAFGGVGMPPPPGGPQAKVPPPAPGQPPPKAPPQHAQGVRTEPGPKFHARDPPELPPQHF